MHILTFDNPLFDLKKTNADKCITEGEIIPVDYSAVEKLDASIRDICEKHALEELQAVSEYLKSVQN